MVTRRRFIVAGGAVGVTLLVPGSLRLSQANAAVVSGGTLDPTRVPKYVTPLFILPQMPKVSGSGGLDSYEIAARQFGQQILPTGFPSTQVFGYGAPGTPSFHYPAYTIEATANRPVRVTWRNQLVTGSGKIGRAHV